MPSLPVLTGGAALHHLHRDLSFGTLQSHARSRSLHAPPVTAAELYDVCGAANELVRNHNTLADFAVVWLGEPPQGARSRDAGVFPGLLEDARAVVCVQDSGRNVSTVLWLDGAILAPLKCPDDALAAAHAFFMANDMAMTDFTAVNTAATLLPEWSATRAAAVVATAARAWCSDVSVLQAIEALPPSDAFVVQHDKVAKLADAAIADILADDSVPPPTPSSPVHPPTQPPVVEASPSEVHLAFNDRVNVFF